ncbi:hypothetical protein BDB00DRAFT_767392 [Zychaea mexicana]|uniref:uncharacterized protein n=1 Tax=Zychaea mexicana TaxID=64656 RepID=UPI0022FEC777|nr:uncharacterized protein BDB00DRAFT_767392 [Zychaea mexicana]KAI9491310.1 hypothetical protein BDB00DRAFT_767392 [Zychaea mexicana]
MPSFFDPAAPKKAPRPPRQLISDLMFPELERQLSDDPALWPNLNGLIKPVITKLKQASRQASGEKVPVVKLQVEDGDVLNFVAGGLTGVKAYTARRIKVRGDLVLAQRLEKLFEKAGGRERAMQFVQRNEHLFGLSTTASKL